MNLKAASNANKKTPRRKCVCGKTMLTSLGNKSIYRGFAPQSCYMAGTIDSFSCKIFSLFLPCKTSILCHKRFSQSEHREAVVFSTVLHPTFPSCPEHMSH